MESINPKKTRPWLILFFIAAAANLIGISFHLEAISIISKPGLMILLGIYFYNSVQKSTKHGFVRTALLALVFSWLGDVLLIFEGLFLFGLGAFLIAQLFYVFTYRKASMAVEDNRSTFIRRLFWSVTLIFFGFILLYIMYPFLEDLFIPVSVYCLVIVTMGIMAVQRNGLTSQLSYSLTLFGALLFLTSDAILGINRFVGPIENGHFFVMFTYIFAQWFIIEGLIQHYKFLQIDDSAKNILD